MEQQLISMIGNTVVSFILGFLAFGCLLSTSNKKIHKETLLENENLKKEVSNLKVKIDNLLDSIIDIKNKI